MAERPPPYITNERYKSVSRTLFQLGGALLAAAVIKGYATASLSIETIGWLFIGGVLIWLGRMTLGLLEPEK